MKTNRGFIVPLLLGVIALLVIVGGVYIYQNKKAEAPAVVHTSIDQPTQQELNPGYLSIDISNWKTYIDDQDGFFQIKYPSGWHQSIHGPNLVLSDSDCINCDPPTLSINPHPGSTLEKVYESNMGKDKNLEKDCTKIIFSGISAHKCASSSELYNGTSYFFYNQGIPIHIDDSFDNDISHRILSTFFKFTNTANISNWKTYKNSQYGFEVQYPPQLKPREEFDVPAGLNAAPTVTFDYPAISDYGPKGNWVYAFYVSYSSDLKSLYQFTGHSDPWGWEDKGMTIVGGVAAEKFFSSLYNGGSTAYLIQSKNIGITFISSDISKISPSDLDKILQSFKFTK